MDTVWTFETRNFRVSLIVEREQDYLYDEDDEDGSTQAELDAGELVAFDSSVVVEHIPMGVELSRDSLGGSVYKWNDVQDFWTAHRDRDPMNRNCSLMRNARGENVCICHYFPGMVSEAISEARRNLKLIKEAA